MTRQILLATVVAVTFAGGAAHATNLIVNGDFSDNTGGGGSFELSNQSGWTAPGATVADPSGVAGWVVEPALASGAATSTPGQSSPSISSATGNYNSPFNLLFQQSTASTTSADSYYTPSEAQHLDSAFVPLSGTTYIMGLDGDPSFNGYLEQDVTGLTPGDVYTVTFDWAATELSNRSGNTADELVVGLSDSEMTASNTDYSGSYTLGPVQVASQGFSPWTLESLTFTADSDSEWLSFLAEGIPEGLPPFVLLADVALNTPTSGTPIPAPEPGTLALLGTGFVAMAGVALRRRRG